MPVRILPSLVVAAFLASHTTSQPISATTAAMYHAHHDGTGEVLDLLVLLRGSPGWFQRDGGTKSSGMSSSRGISHQFAVFGGKTFSIDINQEARTATVLDHDVTLAEANVVLFDDADNIVPTFIGTRQVDPHIPPEAIEPIAAVIRTSPELFEYLRCDATMPADPSTPADVTLAMQTVFTMLCARMRGQ